MNKKEMSIEAKLLESLLKTVIKKNPVDYKRKWKKISSSELIYSQVVYIILLIVIWIYTLHYFYVCQWAIWWKQIFEYHLPSGHAKMRRRSGMSFGSNQFMTNFVTGLGSIMLNNSPIPFIIFILWSLQSTKEIFLCL